MVIRLLQHWDLKTLYENLNKARRPSSTVLHDVIGTVNNRFEMVVLTTSPVVGLMSVAMGAHTLMYQWYASIMKVQNWKT